MKKKRIIICKINIKNTIKVKKIKNIQKHIGIKNILNCDGEENNENKNMEPNSMTIQCSQKIKN